MSDWDHKSLELPSTAIDSSAKEGIRKISICILLAAAGVLLALALPAMFGHVYVADDLGEFHIPVRVFYARQLGAGQPFDWMPSLFGGFYITAEGQLGAYHPIHWLLYRTLPLNIAFDVELLISYPFLFCGMWLFLRRLTGSHSAGMYGALAFTFGSFMLLHFLHPNAIAVIAHIPWLLLTMDVALQAKPRALEAMAELAIGLIVASQMLLGHPQCVWFTALAAAGLVIYRYPNVAQPMRRLVRVSAVIAMGLATGAVQWMATLHMLISSTRNTVDSAFVNMGSLHPLNLIQVVAPYLFKMRVVGQNTHELGIYVGAVPFVLCAFLIANKNSWGGYRKFVWALIFFGAFSLLLAGGEYGGLYRLQSIIPLANRFRFPCRAIVLVQLCVAGCAGVAFAILGEGKRDISFNFRGLALAVISAIVFAVIWPMIVPQFVSTSVWVWLGPGLIILAAGLVIWAARGSQIAMFLLVLFTAIDLGAYGLSYSVWQKTEKFEEYVAGAPQPPVTSGVRVVAPTAISEPSIGDRMLIKGLTRIDGYAGLQPARCLDYSRESTWRLAGAQWAYLPDGSTSRRKWYAVLQPVRRAHLSNNNSAAIIVHRDEPGLVQLEVKTAAPDTLALTESYDSGWRVTVDGREAAASRIYGDFLGCTVTVGKHDVCFQFKPRCRQGGIIVSLCGIAVLFVFCVFRLFKALSESGA